MDRVIFGVNCFRKTELKKLYWSWGNPSAKMPSKVQKEKETSLMMQFTFEIEEKSSKIVHAPSTSKVYRGLLGDLSAQGSNYSSFLLIVIFTGPSCSVHQSWEEASAERGAGQLACSGKLPITLAVNFSVFLVLSVNVDL